MFLIKYSLIVALLGHEMCVLIPRITQSVNKGCHYSEVIEWVFAFGCLHDCTSLHASQKAEIEKEIKIVYIYHVVSTLLLKLRWLVIGSHSYT